MALVVGVVLVANLLYLTGVFDANPIASFAYTGPLVHGGVLAGRQTIDPNAGYTTQALGHLAASDILHGRLPWWNPYEGLGTPLAGEMQSAAFFPPTLLLWFGGGHIWLQLLLEVVSGLAMMRVLRRVDCGRWVAAALACAFALCGTFAWFAGQPIDPIVCLPLLVLGIERAREAAAGDRRLGFALIAVALALSIYAGFPETAYLDGLVAGLWALARGVGLDRRALLRYATRLAAGLVSGVLVAAPVLVAFVDYLPNASLGPHTGGAFDLVSLPHPAFGALFFPYLFGPIFGYYTVPHSSTLLHFWSEVGGFLTTSLLVLDVLALWDRRHRVLKVALALWLLVALGRIYGVGPLWHAFDLLPFMGRVSAYRYLPPAVSFAAVALGALGADDVRRGAVARGYAAGALLAAGGVLAVGAAEGGSIVSAISGAPGASSWATGSLVWGFAILACVGGAAVALRGRWRTGVVLGCVVADALGMYMVAELSAPRSVAYDAGFVAYLRTHDTTGRFFTLGPLQADFGSYFGAAEADQNDMPFPKAYHRYIAAHLDTNLPFQFTAVASATASGPSPFDELVAHIRAYEAIGVADVVSFSGTIPSSTVSSLGLRKVYTDRFAVVYATPHPAPFYRTSAGCRLSHGSIGAVSVDCPRPGTLVRLEQFMPGWSATARGSTLAVRPDATPAPDLAQTVRVPAGTSTVRFSFTPPHEGAALAALAVGALLVAAPYVLDALWPRRRGRHAR